MLELRDAELEIADDVARRRSELRGGPRGGASRRLAEARRLAPPAVEHVRDRRCAPRRARRPRRAPISAASSSACCATSATAPSPARLSVSSGPRSLAGSAMGAGCAPLLATLALRRGRPGSGRRHRRARAARAPASRRRRPPLRRSRPSAASSSASAASVPPTDGHARERSEVVAAARELRLASPSALASSGAARKIDEYEPAPIPMRSANAKSLSVSPPKT